MANEKDNIELRSEELDSILGKTPGTLIRWGITAVSSFFFILFIGSFFFKYPEIIEAPVEVTTQNPPASMVARSSGKITNLFVVDREIVKKNTVLATIENPADYSQIQLLQSLLEKLKPSVETRNTNASFSISMYPLNKLGEVQPAFTAFTKALSDVVRYYQINIYPQKMAAINKQIAMTKLYNTRLRSQSKLVEQDLRIGSIQHNRDSLLYKNKIIAQAELDNSTSSQIQKKYSFEGAQLTLADSQIKLALLDQQLLDLRLQAEQEEKQLYLNLEESHKNLVNEITTWEQRYVLRSPIDGRVNYTKFWSVNQNINIGETVLTVVPEKKTEIIGKLSLPMMGAGKVKVGQVVNIRFDNYPYMEYGTVFAQVLNISMTTADNVYPVELRLPHGLKTNYKTSLRYSNGMKGVAQIITEDLTLFQRFFNPVKSLFKKHFESYELQNNDEFPKDSTSQKTPTHKVVIKRFYEKK